MVNIGLIGAGSIGQRHLESVVAVSQEYEIYIIEKKDTTVQEIKKTYGNRVKFADYSNLPDLDLCIIATASDVRREVFEMLTDNVKVKYIIFEKVLFQKIEDYYYVYLKLMEKGIKSWVNCTRREQNSYIELKKEMDQCSQFTFTVSGGEWGLCCNGIHMMDLMEYMAGNNSYVMDSLALQLPLKESKRKGFYELYGSLTGSNGRCSFFQITCMKNVTVPVIITILGDKVHAVIDEAGQMMYISQKSDEWNWKSQKFELQYTSEISGEIVKKIIDSGFCNLPDYETAMKTHIKFLNCIFNLFRKNNMEDEICPIT